ncbi:TIGR02117 family protein [Neorhizobium sp. DAR64872/K0K18]|uniref:TIGR02117 family protein n=1 Tax=Neorhizobium sp. DAR64872/K0K18 TaxID=3421958 RepID=UPI003D2A25A8
MKRFARRLLLAIPVIGLLIVLAVAIGTFVPRPLFAPDPPHASENTRRILVLSNPIHTDLVIPLDAETRASYSFLDSSGIPVADPAAEWLVIGWGGRSFYLETPTWADLKPMPAFRALTIDSSVMHVDVAGGIDDTHPAVQAFDLDADQFQAMSDFIRASFVEVDNKVVPIPGAGYGVYDRFFEAHGSFNALVGCNTWTARALRAAGLRTGLWNPLPQLLALSLRIFN